MTEKQQYAKAAGFSLFLHALLLGFLLIAGHFFTQPIIAAVPVEIDFLGVSQADTGVSQNENLSEDFSESEKKTLHTSSGQPSEAIFQESGTRQNSTQAAGIHNGPVSQAATFRTVAAGPAGRQETSLKRAAVRTQASCVASFKPAYPREALAAGWEGSVIVRVFIATDGLPDSVTVKTSSGYSILDEAAARAVKKMAFFSGSSG